MTSLQKQISLKPEDKSIYSNKKHFNKVAQSKKASALITIKDFNARNEKNVNDNRDNNDNCTNCYCNDDDTETSIISEDYAIQFIKDSDNIGLNNFEQADAKNSIRKSINNDNFKTAFDTSSISDLNSSINISQVQEIQKDIIKNINDIISNDEEMKYNKDNKDKKRNSNISNDNESKKNTKSNNNNTNNYNGEFNNSTITTKANIKTSSRINGDVNEKNINNNNNNKPNNNTANNNITSYNRIDPMNINSNNVYNNSNNAYFLNPQNSINSSNNTNYFSPLPSFPIYNNNQTIGFCNNMYSSSTHMNNQNSQNINTNFNNNMINYPYNTINMAQNTNNNICSYYTLPKNAILNNNTTNMNMINANIFNQPQQHLNYLNPTNQVNQIYIPINPNLQYNISNINGMSNIPINTYINTVGIKIPYSQSNINSNMQSNCSSSMISMVNNIQNNLSNLKNDCKKTSSDSILDSKSIYASNNSSLGSNKKENHSIYQISDSKSSSDVNANKTNNKIDCKGNNNNNNETKERNDKNTPDNTHSKSSNKKFKKITVDNLTEINVLHIIKSQNSTHSFLSKLEQNYNKQKKENIETLSTDNTAKDSNSNSDCSDKEANKDILNFSIFPQILNNLNSLTHNENGNYLLQKLIPKLNKENSTILFNYVKSNFENLSTHFLGTRIVQRVLENAEVSLLNTLVEEIKLHLAMLCHDYNGIHVVSKFMLHNNNNCEFIFDFLINNFLSVSSDKEGCCLIQKVMQMTQHQDKINQMTDIIIKEINFLAVNQYANYVIDFIIDKDVSLVNDVNNNTNSNSSPNNSKNKKKNSNKNSLKDNNNNKTNNINIKDNNKLSKRVKEILLLLTEKRKFVYLCKQKYSSNLIEKCLDRNNSKMNSIILKALLKQSQQTLIDLLCDKNGFYIIYKALTILDEPYLKLMTKLVKDNISLLESKQGYGKVYSKKLITKFPALSNK